MADVRTAYNLTLQAGSVALGNGSTLDCGGLALIAAQLSGTFVATVTFEATTDEVNWVGVQATNANTLATGSTATAPGLFIIPAGGFSQFRARISAFTSGAITVKAKGLADGFSVLGQIGLTSSLPGGTNKIGGVDLDSDATTGSAVPAVAQLVAGTDGTNARGLKTNTSGELQAGVVALPASTNTLEVVGDVAHDAVSAGNPVLAGGFAVSTEPAAVANADTSHLLTDLVGKLITLPYANPENFLSGKTAAITGTADTSIIAAQGAGVRIYVTSMTVCNSHATVGTEVVVKDNTTELFRVFVAAASGTAGPQTVTVTFPTPLRLTANVALQAANITTGSNSFVSAQGYKGA